MISIVLYGRNDNYGYNLHKRAALSLNCMAEVLTDPADEILFVDYNTPDDFPTFPEAIQDTLTRRAREMLRIFRVRPRVHERFKSKTHLLALEPIARNAAIRRSSEANRWILSTNTDMVFVPLRDGSLSEIVLGLAPAFYHAPRIEIPEVLWESLDRKDAASVIKAVRQWGTRLHLNEIVLGSKVILYDGPGDFQLILRSDLFEHHGFDERMLLGWHVDSNIAARLRLKYGQVGDLGQEVYGYHCDHTRQVTPAHSHTRVQNDWRRFVAEVVETGIPEQADVWGCKDDPIEELRLANNANVYVQVLRGSIGKPLAAAKIVQYTGLTYNKVDYDPSHVLPFLADIFAPMPRDINVAWYGLQEGTLSLFARAWKNLGFSGRVLVDRALLLALTESCTIGKTSSAEVLAGADVFIFDFGGASSETIALGLPIRDLLRCFLQVVRSERHRLLVGERPRRIVALNAINNDQEGFVCGLVAAAVTPFATHMRHGFVLPPSTAAVSWLAELGIGEAGIRVGNEIRNIPTKRGWIAYGPCKYLDEGTYGVSLKIELIGSDERQFLKREPCLFVEVRAGQNLLALHLLRYGDLLAQDHNFQFTVPSEVAAGDDGVETRIAIMAPNAIVVRALSVQRISASIAVEHKIPAVLRLEDWLPFLRVGRLGRASEHGVVAKKGQGDFVIYGPYWSLANGMYEVTVEFEKELTGQRTDQRVTADVLANGRQIALATFDLTALPNVSDETVRVLRLPFELGGVALEQQQVETRVWSSGKEEFTIRSVMVKLMEREQTNLLACLLIREAGEHISGEIRNRARRTGMVAHSPIIWLEPRAYKLKASVIAQAGDGAAGQPCAFLVITHGFNVIDVLTIKTAESTAEQYDLAFEIPSHSEQATGIQILLQIAATVDLRVRSLTIEPIPAGSVRPSERGIFIIQNWLPFLNIGPIGHAEGNGVVVNDGQPGYAIYGPYWTLPPGAYELIGLMVPLTSDAEGESVITVDVATEQGHRKLVEHQWHLGHLRPRESAELLVELRMPFNLTADLPPALRTIETRIFSSGRGRFQMRSLAVKPRLSKGKWDWFPYLAISECGIYNGQEIKSISGKRGCMATTPLIPIKPGQYKLAAAGIAAGRLSYVGIEIWSGTELIAIGTLARGLTLEFCVTEDAAQRGVKLFLLAASAAVVSLCSLVVEKTSNSAEPNPVPPALQLDDWLPFLQTKPIAHVEEDGILVDEGEAGYAIYGPYWTLPPGGYELTGSVEPITPDPAGVPLITIDVSTDAGQRRFVEHRWHVGHFHCGDRAIAGEVRLPFTLSADLSLAQRTIETRIFTSGEGSFRVRSLVVNRISDTDTRKQPRQRDSAVLDLDVYRTLRAAVHRVKLQLLKSYSRIRGR